MKTKYFLILVFMLFFIGCSDEDTNSPVANTEWVTKITSANISVPEQYREHGYWVLRFTKKEFTITVNQDGYDVIEDFRGSYQTVSENKIIGKATDGTGIEFYLRKEENLIFCPYYGQNFQKQGKAQ